MTHKKHIASACIMSLVMVFSGIGYLPELPCNTQTASAATGGTVPGPGGYGSLFQWELNQMGQGFELVLSGFDNVRHIPDDLFAHSYDAPWWGYAGQIYSIVIEDSFPNIPDYFFQGYPHLKQVSILGKSLFSERWSPEGTIGLHAFDNCPNLRIISGDGEFPFEIENLNKGFEAYADWGNDSIHLAMLDPQYTAAYYGCQYINAGDIIAKGAQSDYSSWLLSSSGTLYLIPSHELHTWQKLNLSDPQAVTKVVFCGDCTSLEGTVFSDMTNLKEIILPDTLDTIGDNTFENCTSLTEITLPDNLRRIGSGAFRGCSALKSIELPESIQLIGANAFNNCTALENADFSRCQNLDMFRSLFIGCTSLKTVQLPKNIVTITQDTFEYCTSLDTISLPDHFQADIIFLPSSIPYLVIPSTVRSNLNIMFINPGAAAQTVVYGKADSVAEQIANSYGLTLKPISELFGVKEKDGVISGHFYRNTQLTWTLDAEGLLTVSGYGNWSNVECAELIPWYDYKSQIKKTVIESGTFSILGDYFSICPNLTEVQFPDSVYQIDQHIQWNGGISISAHEGSYAEQYAKETGSPFKVVPRYSFRYLSNINNWGFLNTEEYFRSRDTHFILDEYRQKLLSEADDTTSGAKIANTEKYRIEAQLDSQWNGSCWGMAVTSILSCYNGIDPTAYSSSAKTLHDLPNTEEVESLLNYYWALQFTNKLRSSIEQFKKQKDKIKIETLLNEIANEKPTLLAYSFPKGDHAVVAYGYTAGDYRFEIDGTEYSYNIKVNLYDNITDNTLADDASCLYINTQTPNYYQWYIPKYDAVHNSKLEKNNSGGISFVCSDVSLLNYRGYLSGNAAQDNLPYTSTLQTKDIDNIENFQVLSNSINGSDQTVTLGKATSYNGGSAENEQYVFHINDADSGCRLSFRTPNKQELTMEYENCTIAVRTTNSKSVSFLPDGEYVSVSGINTNYDIDLVFNDGYTATNWDLLNIRSESSVSNVSVSKASAAVNGKNGFILTANRLDQIAVSSQSGSAHCAVVRFSAPDSSVLICNDGKGEISVLADRNQDGIYETVVLSAAKCAELTENQCHEVTGSTVPKVYVGFSAEILPGWQLEDYGILCYNSGNVIHTEHLTLDNVGVCGIRKINDWNAEIVDNGYGVTAVGFVTARDVTGKACTMYTGELGGEYAELKPVKLTRMDNKAVTSNGVNKVFVGFSAELPEGSTLEDYGLIYYNSGNVIHTEHLTLDNVGVCGIKKAKYWSANITDLGHGVVCVGFVKVKDKKGNVTTHYTEELGNSVAEMSAITKKVTLTKQANKAVASNGKNKVYCGFNANLPNGYTVEDYGLIYYNSGNVIHTEHLTLENVGVCGIQKAKYWGANITDIGYGVVCVGFVKVKAPNGYVTTVYTGELGGSFTAVSEAAAANAVTLTKQANKAVSSGGKNKVYCGFTANTAVGYTVEDYGLIYYNSGNVIHTEHLTLGNVGVCGIQNAKYWGANITDKGYGVACVGFVKVKDAYGYVTTLYTGELGAKYTDLSK